MTVHSIGDQARAFALQSASFRLKTTLATLTDELASGEVADPGQRLGGNTQILGHIEARISAIGQFDTGAQEAALLLQGTQDSLESVHDQTSALALSLVAEPFNETPSLLQMRASEVTGAFEGTVARFNRAVADRFLFSGLNSDTPPLSSASDILDALEVATAGLTTATDVAQTVSDWFDAPPGGGGFMDMAYLGTVGEPASIGIADGEAISLSTTAAAPALRDVLKGLATAALVDRGALSGQHQERRDLMQRGGQILLDNGPQLVSEMGRVGLKQQLTMRARTENAAMLAGLQTARNDIRSADPYETAGALQQVQSQLEALYSVTARLSTLKLVEYLR